ncbi:MAG: terminase large subunit domain-containing protein [Psychrobium sp.]
MQIELALTKPQKIFAKTDSPYPAIVGGLGSGKSEGGLARMLLLMVENYIHTSKPVNTLITFPTYDLCKLRGMAGIQELLDRSGIPYKSNSSNYSVDIWGIGTMLFRSYDRPERIVAFEVAHSLCDELDTLPREKADLVWRKVSERTRAESYRPNSVGVVTTPDQGIHGFVYDKWVKKKQIGYELIKAPTHSNPFLPDGYIDQIRANYDPILADMYIEGEFVSLSDKKVYHFFDRKKHHTDRVIEQGDRLHIGLDFNIGGTCAVVFVIENNNPIAVDEFVSHDTRDFTHNLTKYNGYDLTVYPDASGGSNTTNASASDIEIIRSAGFAVDSPNKNPFVRDRINATNALLAHDRIKVNCDKCPEYAHALETQGYTDKGEPEKFNKHPAIDDWNDGAGYFIHRRFPILAVSSAPRSSW